MTLTADHNLLASAAGRRQAKRGRRLVLAQCSSCNAKGSAVRNAFGKVKTIGIPAVEKTDETGMTRWFHAPCPRGEIRFFDIEVRG